MIADTVSSPESWEQLGDGYRVEASFILWEEENILQIPTSALFRHQEGWAAFVVENQKAHLRQVEIGRRNGLSAEITTGLNEGELVVLHPDEAIEDGTAVHLRTG